MPKLDAIGIVSADLDRTRAFYALLGVEIAEGDDHVEATLPSGIRLMFDTEDVMRSFRPDWTRDDGQHGRARLRVRQPGRGGRGLRARRRRRVPRREGAVGRVLGPALRAARRSRRHAGRPLRSALIEESRRPRRAEPVDPAAAERRRAHRRGGVRRGGVPPVLGRAVAEPVWRSPATSRRSSSPGGRCSSSAAASGCRRSPLRCAAPTSSRRTGRRTRSSSCARTPSGTRAPLRVARVRWSEPEPLLRAAPWDIVLGADLLYEERNADQLAALLPRLGGEVLLAEPGRPYAKEFLERLHAEPVGERLYRLAF